MEAEMGATTKGWDELFDEGGQKWKDFVKSSLWNMREPGQAYFGGARHQVRKKLESKECFTCPCGVSLVGCGLRIGSPGCLGRDCFN